MSRVNDQARQQALTRVAASRVRVVDSVEAVRNGVRGCIRAFPLSATALKMGGGVLAGLLVAGVAARKFSGKKAKKTQPKQELKGSTVALQALSAVAIPMLQRWLLSRSAEQTCAVSAEPERKKSPVHLSLPSIHEMFYRWLGLQK